MKLLTCLLILSMYLSSNSSFADTRINGFVSIGAGMTMDSDEVYLVNELSGATYDDDISFKPDSLYAIQVTSDLGNNLTAAAQVLGTGGNDFEAEFEWAYISYKILPELTVQAGRLRTPFFLNSLNLDLGYSYNWIRPPVESNQAADLMRRIEGIDFTWSSNLGDFNTTASLTYGSSTVNAIVSLGPSEIDFTEIVGLTGKVSYEWLTFRGGYLESEAAITPEALGFTLPVNAGTKIRTFAVVADLFPLRLEAEIFNRAFPDNVGNDDEGWFVMGAYTIGDFTPHLTFSGFKDTDTNSDPLAVEDFKSITVGLRYNFHPSAAFKVEYISRTVDTTEQGAAALSARGGIPVVDTDLVVVAVDLVF